MATVSIIMATYNRAKLLDDCLHHLRRQRFEPGDEVIVIDNGSTDATSAVLAQHAASFPVPFRHLRERRPGKSHAVAAGVAFARGDIWAFIDDDVNVTPTWLTVLRDALKDERIALVGGPVVPRWECRAPSWLRTAAGTRARFTAPLALLDFGSSSCEIGERTLLGANLAIRREVMQQMGGFSTELGKLRGTLLSGEDHDLCRRVQSAGFTAVYTPSAVVHHWVPRERMRLRYFFAWFYWSGITNAALDASQPRAGRMFLGVPAYLVRRFVVGLATSPVAALRGRIGEAVDRMLDVAFAAGYAAGQWRLVTVTGSEAPLRRAT